RGYRPIRSVLPGYPRAGAHLPTGAAGQVPANRRGARRSAAAGGAYSAADGSRAAAGAHPRAAPYWPGGRSPGLRTRAGASHGPGFEIRGGEHPFMPVEAFYLDDPDGNEIEIATWRG